MSVTKIILTIALALGAFAPGFAQTAATVQGPPGNNAVAQESGVAPSHATDGTVADTRVANTERQEHNGDAVPQREAESAAPSGNASQNATPQGENNLPSSGSSLPLLSVIGFGVLVGGIASALKTR